MQVDMASADTGEEKNGVYALLSAYPKIRHEGCVRFLIRSYFIGDERALETVSKDDKERVAATDELVHAWLSQEASCEATIAKGKASWEKVITEEQELEIVPCHCEACGGRGEKGDSASDHIMCQYRSYYTWEYWTIRAHQGQRIKFRVVDERSHDDALSQLCTLFGP